MVCRFFVYMYLAFFFVAFPLSAYLLFDKYLGSFRAAFISAEFTDISFEVKAVLCLDFYASRDVFRRSETVLQNRIVNNHFELERTIPKN